MTDSPGLRVVWPTGDESALAQSRHQISSFPSVEALVEKLTQRGVQRRDPRLHRAMQDLQWAGHEPASDSGHLRYYPNGALVFGLIKDWHEGILTRELGATEVRTPFLYDWDQASLQEQVQPFKERLYYAAGYQSRRRFVMRYGGDAGLFNLLRSARMTHKHLPLRVYEFAQTFRYNRHGEVRGLDRPRAFSFFDFHGIAADPDAGWRELQAHFEAQFARLKSMGIECGVRLVLTEDLFAARRASVSHFARLAARPVLVHVLARPKQYWSCKYQIYDAQARSLFSSQYDTETAGRFGIRFVNRDGRLASCTLCHTSFGSIEMWMSLALASGLARPVPVLPTWLSPTQLRLIAVDGCAAIAFECASAARLSEVRADVDDRDRPVGWRVHAAEREWIPYTVVLGPAEQGGGTWHVRQPGGAPFETTAQALFERIRAETRGMPFRPRVDVSVARRPDFSASS